MGDSRSYLSYCRSHYVLLLWPYKTVLIDSVPPCKLGFIVCTNCSSFLAFLNSIGHATWHRWIMLKFLRNDQITWRDYAICTGSCMNFWHVMQEVHPLESKTGRDPLEYTASMTKTGQCAELIIMLSSWHVDVHVTIRPCSTQLVVNSTKLTWASY